MFGKLFNFCHTLNYMYTWIIKKKPSYDILIININQFAVNPLSHLYHGLLHLTNFAFTSRPRRQRREQVQAQVGVRDAAPMAEDHFGTLGSAKGIQIAAISDGRIDCLHRISHSDCYFQLFVKVVGIFRSNVGAHE